MTRKPQPPEAEAAAAYAAADWCTHHVVPLALEQAGMPDLAAAVRGLPAVIDRNRAWQADTAIIGIIDGYRIRFPLRTLLGDAATACMHAAYGSAEAGTHADACATAAVELGVTDDQVRFVADGGEADLVRSIWGLLGLD